MLHDPRHPQLQVSCVPFNHCLQRLISVIRFPETPPNVLHLPGSTPFGVTSQGQVEGAKAPNKALTPKNYCYRSPQRRRVSGALNRPAAVYVTNVTGRMAFGMSMMSRCL